MRWQSDRVIIFVEGELELVGESLSELIGQNYVQDDKVVTILSVPARVFPASDIESSKNLAQ